MIVRRLIISALVISALASLGNSFYASYCVQRDMLIQQVLDKNATYAAQLAESADQFLQSSLQRLGYSASLMVPYLADQDWLQAEAKRLRLQMDSFNSVVIVDARGVVQAAFPESLGIVGVQLSSSGALQALREHHPLISNPYAAVTGRMVVFISQPILDAKGVYLGYVGGTLYLQDANILHSLLGEHYQKGNGSYLYVINQNRQLIYHADAHRVGEQVLGASAIIDALVQGKTGNLRAVNTQGVEMLAGYANIPSAHWGVVAQTPIAVVFLQMRDLMWRVVWESLPLVILGFIGLYVAVRLIADPLRQLVSLSSVQSKEAGVLGRIRAIHPWYFEAIRLKQAIWAQLTLNNPAEILTRQEMAFVLDDCQQTARPFALMILQFSSLANGALEATQPQLEQLIRASLRGNDRFAQGDDQRSFLILLLGTGEEGVTRVSQRLGGALRKIEPNLVTISMGSVCWTSVAGYAAHEAIVKAEHALKSVVL